MTRFSVLIPTRNRLEFLRYAVETVRRQDYDDWELIIADNASGEDVGEYAASLNDPRVIYIRSDEFISVTDNWNRALERSSGEWVIMLGDDDGLLQGYFRRIDALLAKFDNPDAIYTSAYLFSYPGAIREHPDGYLQPYGYATFLRGRSDPFVLDHATASSLVREAVDFKVRYGFNMQFIIVSRALIGTLADHGSFYQSTFPDYFAMNAIFLRAHRIVVEPQPLVVIGISPKSYGSYYSSNQQSIGDQFLGSFPQDASPQLRDVVLPGSSINTGWLFAMDVFERAYGREYGFKVDPRRYRSMQIMTVARQRVDGTMSREDAAAFVQRLSSREVLLYKASVAVHRADSARFLRPLRRVAAKAWHVVGPRLRGPWQAVPWSPRRVEGRYKSVVDVFDAPQADLPR